ACVSSATMTVAQINGALTATYSGDANFGASAFSNSQGPTGPLLPTALNLSATPQTPTLLQPITFTAAIDIGSAPMPAAGVVQFFLDGVKLLGTTKVAGGIATLTL